MLLHSYRREEMENGTMTSSHIWIIEVLRDIECYARMNSLHLLERHLQDSIEILMTDLADLDQTNQATFVLQNGTKKYAILTCPVRDGRKPSGPNKAF